MKSKPIFTFLFVTSVLISACSQGKASFSSSQVEDSSLISDTTSLPAREGGVSLEAFTEAIDALSPQTNNRRIRVTYHIVETLEGSVPNATYRRGGSLPEGETITDLVLESRNDSSTDLKVISDQPTTNFSGSLATGISITIKDWLSYHNERKNVATREAQPGWNIFNEDLKINPFKMWMVYAGNKPANSDVEGTFFSYNEYERTFDANGYCQTILFRDFTYIDGIFSRWDTEPQYYKGTFDAVATATIEYLDLE